DDDENLHNATRQQPAPTVQGLQATPHHTGAHMLRPASLVPESPRPSSRGSTRIAVSAMTQCFSQVPQPVHLSGVTVGSCNTPSSVVMGIRSIASPRTGQRRTQILQVRPLSFR